ncbi:S-adenosyl-L-methionine-dependent methyltransferase [Chytridium lagenaria]|nr:S-adenosyl-L-methionine-dependent methyltransferase [Chytridium lagenaria]
MSSQASIHFSSTYRPTAALQSTLNCCTHLFVRTKSSASKARRVPNPNPLKHLPNNVNEILQDYRQKHSNISIPFLEKAAKQDEIPSPYSMYEETEPLMVLGVSSTGYGICVGRDGWLVLVPTALEGEVVVAKVFLRWMGLCMGDLVKIVKQSEKRIEPKCKYFNNCSGCSFQHISYEDQLKRKKAFVEWEFRRISTTLGGASDLAQPATSLVGDVQASPMPFGYRTKINPHHTSSRANNKLEGLGFVERGRLRKVVDMERCEIATEAINQKFAQTREKVLSEVYPFDRQARTVMFRNTLVHSSGLLTHKLGENSRKPRVNLAKSSSGARLLQFIENMKKDEHNAGESVGSSTHVAARLGLDPTLSGPQMWPPEGFDHDVTTDSKQIVTEVVNGQVFRGPANVFFQLNSSVLGHLTNYVRQQLQEHALPRGLTTLVDAYCGTGLFSLQCSYDFQKVIGLEVDVTAIQWARINAKDNGVKNVSFESGLVSNIFSTVHQNENPDDVAVIMDPSQHGCGPDFLQLLMRFNPRVIIYVSCDVRSQIEDLLIIDELARDGVTPPPISAEVTETIRRLPAELISGQTNAESKPKVLYIGGKKIEIGRDGKVRSKEDVGKENMKEIDGSEDRQIRLKAKGYRIVAVKPFDLFPQTGRIENVVTLVRES